MVVVTSINILVGSLGWIYPGNDHPMQKIEGSEQEGQSTNYGMCLDCPVYVCGLSNLVSREVLPGQGKPCCASE
jgi:hypothetical protein